MRWMRAIFVFFWLVACNQGGATSVRGLDPDFGPTDGNQPVRVLGANFSPESGYSVYFGTQKAESVTLVDRGTLLVASPRNSQPGRVDVTVYADDGSAFRIRNGYEYRVLSTQTGSTDAQKLRY